MIKLSFRIKRCGAVQLQLAFYCKSSCRLRENEAEREREIEREREREIERERGDLNCVQQTHDQKRYSSHLKFV